MTLVERHIARPLLAWPRSRAELTLRASIGQSATLWTTTSMSELREDTARAYPATMPDEASSGVVPSDALSSVMDRYARGDDLAFDDLYRLGAPRVRGFLLRLCGDLALADDLMQETFIRVHRGRGSFAMGAAALPWMLAIARNALRDHARRAQVRPGTRPVDRDAREPLQREAPPDARGDEVLAGQEMLEVVRAVLQQLPALQREAFVLLRFEGMSVSEAAQVLGTTEGAVKVRAFRASEALRAALDQGRRRGA
jgi:RNA polymerase sigma-70 factor (ECF subfamily)